MKEQTKILFVLHVPPPVHGSSIVGGHIKDSKLINDSFDCKFINLGTSKTIDEIGKNTGSKILTYLKILIQVLKQLIVFRPKIVYLTMTAKGLGFYKDAIFTLIAKSFGKQLVLHFHNKGVRERHNKAFDNFLYMLVFRNTRVILLSPLLYNDIEKYVNEDNVFYCPNGIKQLSINNKNTARNDIFRILFLSNLIESKGVFVLLEALEILKNEDVGFHCNFVGGQGDISKINFNKKIEKLNIVDSVEYLGEKYDSEKIELFKDSDLFVLPTFYHNECFPLTLLEASMYGLPIISTNEGGIIDIVKHGETGFIVDKNNPKQLANTIKYLMENRDIAIMMGKKAYRNYKTLYTLEKFESRMCSILNSISLK